MTTRYDIDILISTRSKGSGIEKADRQLGKFSGTLSKLAAGGVLAGAGAALLAFGRQSLQVASDVEEMQSKFNVVFSNVGDQVTKELDKFAEAAGRSRFELMGMASTLGDTLKPMGFSEDAAADFSVQLTQLATDLSSFNNMPMDEALKRLQGTLIGSHENALAFGVVINENTLKAELAANGWDNLTGSQLEAAKVQARINLLMRGTSDAQGDAIRTADSYANQQRALQAAMEELQVTLGTALIPAMSALVGLAQEAAKRLNMAAKATGDYGKQTSEIIDDNLDAAQSFEDLRDQAQNLVGVNEDVGALGKAVTGTTDAINQGVEDTVFAIAELSGSAPELRKNLEDAFEGGRVAMDETNVVIEGVTFNWSQLQNAMTRGNAMREAEHLLRGLTDTSQEYKDILEETRQAELRAAAESGQRAAFQREATHMLAGYNDVSQEYLDHLAERTQAEVTAFQSAEQLATALVQAQAAQDPTAIATAQQEIQGSYRATAFEALLMGAQTEEAFNQAIEAGLAIGAISPEQAAAQQAIGGTSLKIEELNRKLAEGDLNAGTYAAAFATVTSNMNATANAAARLAKEQQAVTSALVEGGAAGAGDYYRELAEGGGAVEPTAITPEVDITSASAALDELSGQLEAYRAEVYMAETDADTGAATSSVDDIQTRLNELERTYTATVQVNQSGNASLPNQPGFSSGGWTGRTGGVVHPNELVIPEDVLRGGVGQMAAFAREHVPAGVMGSGGGMGGPVIENLNLTVQAAGNSPAAIAETAVSKLNSTLSSFRRQGL